MKPTNEDYLFNPFTIPNNEEEQDEDEIYEQYRLNVNREYPVNIDRRLYDDQPDTPNEIEEISMDNLRTNYQPIDDSEINELAENYNFQQHQAKIDAELWAALDTEQDDVDQIDLTVQTDDLLEEMAGCADDDDEEFYPISD